MQRASNGMPPPNDHVQSNKFTSRNPTRVERLLRERELRKSSRGGGGLADEAAGGDGDDAAGSGEAADVGTSAGGGGGGARRESGGSGGALTPFKQRLLVVANRLPVSAVRRSEDSWTLEISAGGLVSALLGKHIYVRSYIFIQ